MRNSSTSQKHINESIFTLAFKHFVDFFLSNFILLYSATAVFIDWRNSININSVFAFLHLPLDLGLDLGPIISPMFICQGFFSELAHQFFSDILHEVRGLQIVKSDGFQNSFLPKFGQKEPKIRYFYIFLKVLLCFSPKNNGELKFFSLLTFHHKLHVW